MWSFVIYLGTVSRDFILNFKISNKLLLILKFELKKKKKKIRIIPKKSFV